MPHGNLATKEGELSDDPHAPPLAVLPGSDYADYWCTAVGLSSRGEVRRVEDFLAQYNLCLAPVSLMLKLSLYGGGGRLRSFKGRSHSNRVVYSVNGSPSSVRYTVLHASTSEIYCRFIAVLMYCKIFKQDPMFNVTCISINNNDRYTCKAISNCKVDNFYSSIENGGGGCASGAVVR